MKWRRANEDYAVSKFMRWGFGCGSSSIRQKRGEMGRIGERNKQPEETKLGSDS